MELIKPKNTHIKTQEEICSDFVTNTEKAKKARHFSAEGTKDLLLL